MVFRPAVANLNHQMSFASFSLCLQPDLDRPLLSSHRSFRNQSSVVTSSFLFRPFVFDVFLVADLLARFAISVSIIVCRSFFHFSEYRWIVIVSLSLPSS
jgi:hypothetical protein